MSENVNLEAKVEEVTVRLANYILGAMESDSAYLQDQIPSLVESFVKLAR